MSNVEKSLDKIDEDNQDMEKGSIHSDGNKDERPFGSGDQKPRKMSTRDQRSNALNDDREMKPMENQDDENLNEKLIGGNIEPAKEGMGEKLMGTNEENLNIRAAIIHILGDMVQSVGVIAAAVIIKIRPDWQIADPICTFLFSILVLITTVPIFIQCTSIIMENTPSEIDTKELYNRILRLKTVEEIHDFHCWSLAGNKFIMTAHIRSNFGDRAIKQINKICESTEFGIYHTTIQVEKENRGANFNSCQHMKY